MTTQDPRMRLAAEWARVGGGFAVRPAEYAVDLERLLAQTAIAAPRDYRALAVATTWISEYAELVNVRRLSKEASALPSLPSAIMGAMIQIAREARTHADRLGPIQDICRPLGESRALFDRIEDNPELRSIMRSESMAAFSAWGLWQDELTLKFDAIRPIRWILENCPELRLRSFYGAGLEAEILQVLDSGTMSIAAIARAVEASYSATHAAVGRLLGRGVIAATAGRGVVLNAPVRTWIEIYPGIARKHRVRLGR